MRDLTGRVFGSYRLEELLGRGGMGEVYRARHLRLANRQAAVKVLPSYLAADPDFLHRFEQEANAAASLDHPNILPVWDYGEQDGLPYLVMPLVEGGSLKELLERHGPLALGRAARITTQLASALDYAHERGIIHRDVKPGNILLAEDGRPVLADFGIAKAIEAEPGRGVTRTGMGIGTPEYTAPEQIEGRAERRSDLYSLGVVLYQMLAGELPYTGATPYEIAYKQMNAPLRPIREVDPALPVAVERVLTRALAKDPRARFASGHDLAAAFDAAIAGRVGHDTPHDLPTRPLVLPEPPPARPARSPAVPAVVAQAPPPTRLYEPQDPPRAPVRYGPARPPAPPPPDRRRRDIGGPLAAAVVIGLLILFALGGALALGLFNRPEPSPTAIPVDAGATATAQAAANATAAAQAAAAAAQATAAAGATQQAQILAGQTATAVIQNAVAATVAAQNTAAAQAAQATAAANQAAATAGAATAQANAARATQAAAQAATATAAAVPTATPTAPPPTVTPTAPQASDWGPALTPLKGGKGYKDPDGRFSLRVPQDWSQIQQSGTDVAFSAPRSGRATPATMNVVLSQTSDSLDQVDQRTQQQIQQQYGDFKLVSRDKVTVNGIPAYRRVFTVTVDGVPVEIEQVYLVDNQVAHMLTFAATPDSFGDSQPTFDGIAGSYQVGK